MTRSVRGDERSRQTAYSLFDGEPALFQKRDQRGGGFEFMEREFGILSDIIRQLDQVLFLGIDDG